MNLEVLIYTWIIFFSGLILGLLNLSFLENILIFTMIMEGGVLISLTESGK